MTAKKNDFSKGSIPGTIIRLALPMIAAQIINALYNIVDRIYIGRIPEVGRLALTGLGLTFPFIMIVSAFASLCGMGGAPLCSIARGEGKNKEAERIMGNAFSMLLFFGLMLTVLGQIIREPVLYLFGASADTFPYANAYITIYLWGSLFVMIGLGMNYFINSQGFAKTGMLTVLIGAVSNILLDPLFIFAFNMGVQGAALATILSQLLSALWTMSFLCGKKTILRLKIANMRPVPAIVKRITGLGFSTFTMNMTESAVQVVCNASLQLYGGDIYVGVMTVVNSLRQVIMMPLKGFANGSQPVIGFNYGAKRYERVRQGVKSTLFICVIYTLFSWAVVQLFPGTLIRIFNSDPELILAGISGLRIYFSFYWIMSLQIVGQTSFVALGKSKEAVFFSLLRKVIIVVPLVLLLPGVFGMGVKGVFVAEPVSDFISGAACFSTFMLTVWPRLRNDQNIAA